MTADPDGDGDDEDFHYVDCDSGGNDTGDCSNPASPCSTIEYAFDQLDGPGDGIEDIICFQGTCTDVEEKNLGNSGVSGFYTVSQSGTQDRSFQFPQDPTMLVGWDVDNDGDVYVVDWINERVVIYNSEAKALAYLHGDAVEMSKWGMLSMEANPDAVKARRRVDDLVEQQKRFRMPTGCTYDRENNRLIVVDTQRSRLQIYEKDASYMDPQFNL